MDKKANMRYWDDIDNLTEDYIRAMFEFGNVVVNDEDDIIRTTKEVVELVTEYLKKEFGADFPYVDENY